MVSKEVPLVITMVLMGNTDATLVVNVELTALDETVVIGNTDAVLVEVPVEEEREVVDD